MWEKIVLNLLSNAFKFTLEGQRSGARSRAMDGHAVLEVADTGIGVPEHELPRLFERFHRVEGAQARTHEGSGIGLALVQELVKLHGGSIEADERARARHDVPRAHSVRRLRIFRPSASRRLAAGLDRDRRAGVRPGGAALAAGCQRRRHVDAGRAERTLGAATQDQRFASTFGARIVLADDNADMRGYVRELLGPLYEVEAVADGAAGARGGAPRARRT